MSEPMKPMEIEQRSFEIITELLGDRKLDPENELVIKRAIHTTADFDYADNLVFSDHAVTKGIEALRAGCGPMLEDIRVERDYPAAGWRPGSASAFSCPPAGRGHAGRSAPAPAASAGRCGSGRSAGGAGRSGLSALPQRLWQHSGIVCHAGGHAPGISAGDVRKGRPAL